MAKRQHCSYDAKFVRIKMHQGYSYLIKYNKGRCSIKAKRLCSGMRTRTRVVALPTTRCNNPYVRLNLRRLRNAQFINDGCRRAAARRRMNLRSTQQLRSTGLPPVSAQPLTSHQNQPRPIFNAQCSSTQTNTNEQAQKSNWNSLWPGISNTPSTSCQNLVHSDVTLTGIVCMICYENPIDSVLYMCGHMCMCYRCAEEQWKKKGNGQCPLCRAQIKDVIRTYKS